MPEWFLRQPPAQACLVLAAVQLPFIVLNCYFVYAERMNVLTPVMLCFSSLSVGWCCGIGYVIRRRK